MIDPELLPYLEASRKAWPIPPHELPIPEYRSRYEDLMVAARSPLDVRLKVDDFHVENDGHAVAVRSYRVPQANPQSALVFMHGGGWVIGSVASHEDIAASLAADTGFAVFSVEYRLAPEHPFPIPFDDCLNTTKHLFEYADRLGLDVSRIVVGGDSAGANIASGIAHALRGSALELRGQLLLYPLLCDNFSSASFIENIAGPVITGAQVRWFLDQYLPDPTQRRNPLAMPAEAKALSGLPPTFIGVAQHDPLRDQGAEYARRLRDAGVDVTLDEGVGLIHGHLRTRRVCRAAEASYEECCKWLDRLSQT